MPYLCWLHHTVRADCVPLDQPDVCEAVERMAAEKRDEDASGPKTVFFGSMKGGTTKLAQQMDHTRKFDRDMHTYREAVRAGENPDQISVEAVRKHRQEMESIERVAI